MNLIGRGDRALVAGLAAAIIVVFARPIVYLLDLAREVEQSSGLALTPALLILVVVFVLHQQGKRQEAKAHSLAAEADASVAEARAEEVERLLMFGQALGHTLDLDGIRDVVVQHLPRLADHPDAWVLLRVHGAWHALAGSTHSGRRDLERERQAVADLAIDHWNSQGEQKDPVVSHGHVCLPMMVGGHRLGVLGMPQSGKSLLDPQRRALEAAATLLGISLRNAELFREVRENSLRDGLTGCYNRTHALDVIDTELRRARRSQAPVSLLMFDIDHFKSVNDRQGHLCGDAVLTAIGGKMREVLRGSDLKCRYGGEEFLVLLPETPIEGAKRVADTLRREIEDMRISWKEHVLRVTASFGVAVALPSEVDAQALIARADAALYRAKEQGRNCVRLGAESAVA
jgi:diguanylate cyclase (GGDEF)-like protein